jgi:CheY-like chemotaxis protein
MGGDITAKSQPGYGTTISFTVEGEEGDSFDNADEELMHQIAAFSLGKAHSRILVVDDKDDNLRILSRYLSPLGFEVREARNGKEAIELWKLWNPSLIWMDLRMPGMGGYEATKHIRELEAQRNAPHSPADDHTIIIAVSASSFEEEHSVALRKGCDDFLRKPFRDTEVFHLLQKHLGVRHDHEQLGRPQTSYKIPDNEIDEDFLRKSLEQLSPELLKLLEHTAITADIIRIHEVLDQIRLQNPKLADGLNYFVENFEYTQLLALIPSNKND